MNIAARAIKSYHPRPADAPHTLFGERVAICQRCALRAGSTCRAASQLVTVMARPTKAHCPQRMWPGDPAKAEVRQPAAIPDAPAAEIRKLAVVTCHFNPMHYRRPRENYDRFAAGIAAAGVPLYTVELAFDDDPFDLPADDGTFAVRGRRSRNLMWQKERLLNLAIAQVPADVDAIAWIDADVLFLEPNWPELTRRLLERRHVVQLFERPYQLRPDAVVEPMNSQWHSTARLYALNGLPAALDFVNDHPGFAWAARADLLRRYGLDDTNVIGGGDCSIVSGYLGIPLAREALIGKPWLASMNSWGESVAAVVQGSVGYVPGAVLHLWHGSVRDRRYRDRWAYLLDHGFDPATDLVIDPNGLWAWSDSAASSKPEMVRRIADYFSARREDDWADGSGA